MPGRPLVSWPSASAYKCGDRDYVDTLCCLLWDYRYVCVSGLTRVCTVQGQSLLDVCVVETMLRLPDAPILYTMA